MPYYLAPYIGRGTRDNAFRPLGSDNQQGWTAINLRPDGGATLDGGGLNACFLYLPIAVANSRLKLLAEDKDELAALATRTEIARIGIVSTELRFASLLADALLTPPPNGWKAIRPNNRTNRFEIYLGPQGQLLWEAPVQRGGATFTENWDAADSASLTAQLTWVESGNSSWEILTNAAHLTNDGSDDAYARCTSDFGSVDNYAQAVITAATRGGGALALNVACRSSSSADTMYVWGRFQDATTTRGELTSIVATAFSPLGNGAAPVVNDTIRVEANGSTIRGLTNGSPIVSVTDPAIDANQFGGIHGYSSNAGNNGRLDNWEGGNLAAADTLFAQCLT